ncbi:MAG: GGDEF domain-containing protein [Clostridia bacterium]|nr:GGDEF domain-containing protein [Clostridia bacterium]
MKNKPREKVSGISLKKLNYLMSAITLLISALLLVSTYVTSIRYNDVKDNTHNYISWQQTAEKLQKASDYLTEEVRAFTISGNKVHCDNYFREANVDRNRDNVIAELKESLAGTEAYADLINAMDKSISLMDREYYSMKLVILATGQNINEYPEQVRNVTLSDEDSALSNSEKLKLAETMVFDDVYAEYKSEIYLNIQKCISALADITEGGIADDFNRLSSILTIQYILIFAIVVVIIGVIVLTSAQVIKPLTKAIPHIKNDRPLPVQGAYEYKYLAKTYNKMYDTNNRQKNQLKFEATHDTLTGVFNRAGYESLCRQFDLTTAAMVLVDIDFFKHVNDESGHETGDRALVITSGELKRNFRTNDLIFRMGGDEFLVIILEAEHSEEFKNTLRSKIERINASLAAPSSDLPLFSVSAGIAFSDGSDDNEEIIKRADVALYHTKNNGRHGCSFYDDIEE